MKLNTNVIIKLSTIFLLLISLTSCKTHCTTAYKITTEKRSYYTDYPTFTKDSVFGAELKRNKQVKENFKLSYDSIVSVKYNNKLYTWK